jgi:hypothetical protein
MFFKRKDTARKNDTPRWRGLQYMLVLMCTAGSTAVVVHTSAKAIHMKLDAVNMALKKR